MISLALIGNSWAAGRVENGAGYEAGQDACSSLWRYGEGRKIKGEVHRWALSAASGVVGFCPLLRPPVPPMEADSSLVVFRAQRDPTSPDWPPPRSCSAETEAPSDPDRLRTERARRAETILASDFHS